MLQAGLTKLEYCWVRQPTNKLKNVLMRQSTCSYNTPKIYRKIECAWLTGIAKTTDLSFITVYISRCTRHDTTRHETWHAATQCQTQVSWHNAAAHASFIADPLKTSSRQRKKYTAWMYYFCEKNTALSYPPDGQCLSSKLVRLVPDSHIQSPRRSLKPFKKPNTSATYVHTPYNTILGNERPLHHVSSTCRQINNRFVWGAALVFASVEIRYFPYTTDAHKHTKVTISCVYSPVKQTIIFKIVLKRKI